jgi:CHASE2 domain-containing sensor protein
LLAASPVIVGTILLALLYSNTSPFRRLETLALDLTMLSRKPASRSDVVIIRITDDDYQKYFGGKSPLDSSAVNKVIAIIASGRPKVIGVDLDTSAEAFQSFEISPDWPPVIWARDANYSNVRRKYHMSAALGGNAPAASYGLVTLQLDSDDAIRRYTRWYDTDTGPAPSLPWAMLSKFRNDESSTVAAPNFEEEFLISYAGPAGSERFFSLTVSMLDELSHRKGWPEDNFLKDKMVILGGDYAVQDEHDTPVGWMSGAEILASIIETEWQGGGYRPLGTPAIILLALFDSIVLLILIQLFGLGRTLFLSVIILPTIALIFSLLFFRTVNYVGYFLLVLIAVLLQQVYEKGKEYLKESREQAANELK